MAEEINNSPFNRIKASLRVFADFSPRDIELILSFEDKDGNIYFYRSADFKYFVTESEWCQVFLDCYVPPINAPDDIVRIFIYNKMNQTFNIDDFHLTFY